VMAGCETLVIVIGGLTAAQAAEGLRQSTG
jgi:hypothetical protein